MRREIKFRGKRLDNGEWVYGYMVRSEARADGSFAYCEIHVPFMDDTYSQIHDVDPNTVGQYVGFSDLNEMEIYEGDILSGPAGNFQVSWYYRYAAFSLKSDAWEDLHFFSDADVCNGGSEVLGNIYENPELIGKEGRS